jgi:serine/threonine-protein kinase
MGSVYRARQIALEKTVAIKVMHPDLLADKTFAARFHREAKAASRLDHPNSIQVLDFGEEPDGLLYIAMEFLNGRDLLHVIEHDPPLPSRRIVDIVSQVLSALSMAHEMGIIHRDLKPENIMILQRRVEESIEELVKVCDFGIAKVADSADSERAPALAPSWGKKGRLTTAGLVVGTPEYMSPEQGRGEALDPRSDLYSVGVVLYHLLAGRIPFDAPTPLGVVVKHQHEEAIPPSAVRQGVDIHLEKVCLTAMRKRPAERYASAREMRSALRAAQGAVVFSPSDPSSASMRVASPLSLAQTVRAESPSGVAQEVVAHSALITAATDMRPWTLRHSGKALAFALGVVVLGGGVWYSTRSPRAPPAPIVASTVPSPSPPTAVPPAAPDPPTPRSVDSPVTPAPRPTTLANAPARPVAAAPSPAPRAHAKEMASPSPASEPPAGSTQEAPPSPQPTPPPPTVPEVPQVVVPPPPLKASPPPFDPSHAHVDVGPVQIVTGGALTSSVNRVLSGVHDKITRCYQTSASAKSPEGTWNLRFLTDDEGNITDVRLDGPLSREVKSCISNAFRGGRVDADTGAVTADVQLVFKLQ